MLQPVDWNEALTVFSAKLKSIQAEHGKGSVAVLSTGQNVGHATKQLLAGERPSISEPMVLDAKGNHARGFMVIPC